MPLPHPRLVACGACQQLAGASAHHMQLWEQMTWPMALWYLAICWCCGYAQMLPGAEDPGTTCCWEESIAQPPQPWELHLDIVVAERLRPEAHHLQLPQHEADVAVCALSQGHQGAVRHLPRQANISTKVGGCVQQQT